MTRQEAKVTTFALRYSGAMQDEVVNFERNRERQQTEGYIPKGRKLNKTQRGGGLKGSFRNARGDSVVNQEKYFVGA
uniref:Uncharacterized protein n=1 Tax=Klebsiella phage vB_Kpn30-P2 TaxID=3230855 RepID=A0AAU8EH45_9VIRU